MRYSFKILNKISLQLNTKIIMVQQYPIVKKRKGMDQDTVDKLNRILMEEVELHEEEENLIVWDSHLNFINRWKSLCLEHVYVLKFTPEQKREWRCDDMLHPGPIIMDHLADMLLNFICGQ